MNTSPFLSPRLSGARFIGGAIPLEFLKDLAVLEEMIIEVAKAEFIKDHPDRKRSPRGFTEGLDMKLTAVENGSAIPVISLVTAIATLLPTTSQTYYERARDSIIRAIYAAENRQSIIEHLPEKTLGYFDRLGRSLRDNEAIEFTTSNGQGLARLTKETRRTLLLASPKVTELTEEFAARGAVPEVDQDDMSFEIQLVDGRKVKAPLANHYSDTIIEAFNGYKSGIRVVLQGVGRFNRNERLVGFDSIEHASILEALDVPARLEEIALLRDGWLEGGGRAPLRHEMLWLTQAFTLRYPVDLPLPYIYPTPEGGIQMEWALGRTEITLEISLDNHAGSWHSLNLDSDEECERHLALDDTEDWAWLAQQIRTKDGDVA
jgi:hypothetical protein